MEESQKKAKEGLGDWQKELEGPTVCFLIVFWVIFFLVFGAVSLKATIWY